MVKQDIYDMTYVHPLIYIILNPSKNPRVAGCQGPDTRPLVCLGALNAEIASEARREVSVTSFSSSAAS